MAKLQQYYGIPRGSSDIVVFPKADTAVSAFHKYLEEHRGVIGTVNSVPVEFSLFLNRQELTELQDQLREHFLETAEHVEQFYVCFRSMSVILSSIASREGAIAGPVNAASLDAVMDEESALVPAT